MRVCMCAGRVAGWHAVAACSNAGVGTRLPRWGYGIPAGHPSVIVCARGGSIGVSVTQSRACPMRETVCRGEVQQWCKRTDQGAELCSVR